MACKEKFKEAYETGDPDKITCYTTKIKFGSDRTIKNAKDYKPVPKPKQQIGHTSIQTLAQPQAQTLQVLSTPLNKYEKEWQKLMENGFKDNEMTGYAYGVHQNLSYGGIDPRVDPEKYCYN